MGRVVVVGSLNLDLVLTVDRLPTPGETVAGSSVVRHAGGKGLNQAIAAARAGAAVAIVGCVGADGSMLVDALVAAGVDVTGVSVAPDVPTGTALITVGGGENTVVVVAGANAVATYEPGAADVVVAQFEIPLDVTAAAFRHARSIGATTILNPSPAAPVPSDLLALVDVLVVNELEDALVGPFGGTRVVTLGPRGVSAATPTSSVSIPGEAVEVVDPTGAGDCFTGYLAASLSDGAGLIEALTLANAAAAISVTRPGAAASIPARAEVPH